MRKFIVLFLVLVSVVLSLTGCGKGNAETNAKPEPFVRANKARFTGDYNREFNDLPEVHLAAAIRNGIEPMASRSDTLACKDKLVHLPNELELYKMYDLKYSIPFLVPSAATLLMDISRNFRDSLYSKDLPLYRLFLTSVTRTNEDVTNLTKKNFNAIDNSSHRYATTFDISWKRFDAVDSLDSLQQISPERLKLVLAQVLFDLKNQQRCFVKHERKQACFHITVR
jgi:predicted small lipoprotein YifL